MMEYSNPYNMRARGLLTVEEMYGEEGARTLLGNKTEKKNDPDDLRAVALRERWFG